MSRHQEEAESGDLVLVRSTDNGESWSNGRVVYQAHKGEPRAMGTLTALRSDRIIAPFTELANSQTISRVRILTSQNIGKSWRDTDVQADIPLVWWVPTGRVIETDDGVYGAASHDRLKATIHDCGLLRSTDGGISWSNYSLISRGADPVHGTAEISRFAFESPQIQVLPDGRWLAMITARRLNRSANGPTTINEGSGAPQVLCRLWSTDEGRTWSQPDQFVPGAWPGVAVAGQDTLCANTLWCAWGRCVCS